MPLRAFLLTLAAMLVLAAPATAEPTWAPADTADIAPGSQTYTDGAQCTSNFVFFDGANNVYIGQAAHCSGTGAATETNGCDAESLPLGTKVEVEGADHLGTMVYNSWIAMQEENESNDNACEYNDFALVALQPADFDKVNPSIPFWGGPTGIATSTTSGEKVLSYGNSSLRGGVRALSPKEGTSLGQCCGGWTHDVYTASPGVPGDSGSAFINGSAGRAFGVLSTVALAPFPGSNGVSDLSRALSYMRTHSSFTGVQLALGTEPFAGPLLPG